MPAKTLFARVNAPLRKCTPAVPPTVSAMLPKKVQWFMDAVCEVEPRLRNSVPSTLPGPLSPPPLQVILPAKRQWSKAVPDALPSTQTMPPWV